MVDKGFFIAFCGLFLLIGVVFILVGLMIFRVYKHKKEVCTSLTDAIVVDMHINISTDSDGTHSKTYAPVLEYNVSGYSYRNFEGTHSGTFEYEIGQHIELLYNPDNPDEFIIDNDNSSKTMAVIFICVGSLCAGIGIIAAVIGIAVSLNH